MIKKEISRQEFSNLLLSSITNIDKFNSHVEKLGITVKPLTGYEYYFGDDFVCSTEDLCVDDLLEKAGFEVQD